MDNKLILELVNIALTSDKRTIQMAVRRFASKVRASDQNLYEQLSIRLNSMSLRGVGTCSVPIPVDSDSRLKLIRIEQPVVLKQKPIHAPKIKVILEQVLLERQYTEELLREGVQPTRSIIFQGPPGVGKTMSARWIAKQLDLPLLILDLATVMSSFLGKTGSNVRSVLDHATSFPCVLLLDEFDAIAKRRDDDRELGELKRLVTVLLQAIDDWPSSSLLIAATNHGELLDPAVWRRFDLEIDFGMPDLKMINDYVESYWPDVSFNLSELQTKFENKSFSFIDRELRKAKRESIIATIISPSLLAGNNAENLSSCSREQKKQLVKLFYEKGESQRSIAEKLGISRPTVKKYIEEINSENG